MDEEADHTPANPVLPRTHDSRGWVLARRRATELLIVFLGVYAAFLLNRFDSYRRDSKRRAQIMEALEHETQVGVDELTQAIADNAPLMAEFDRRLAAGEMPGLSISMNNSTYSATDDAALLQAGGLELLDVQTIELLRVVNAMERATMAERHNQFELSLVELTNREPAEFYDPATRKLKHRYEWWPYVQHLALADAKTLLEAEKTLLTHLKSERTNR